MFISTLKIFDSLYYKNLIDKNVQVTFLPQEFFDARIGEYRTLNVILKLEITEN